MLVKLAFISFVLLWLVAVFKILLLDVEEKRDASHLLMFVNTRKSRNGNNTDTVQTVAYRTDDQSFVRAKVQTESAVVSSIGPKSIPIISEWLRVRSSTGYKIDAEDSLGHHPVAIDTSPAKIIHKQDNTAEIVIHQKQASHLTWPPVEKDGTLSKEDGNETMPIIGLSVPRFWEAPVEADINKIGTKVKGQETIFLMIASYRDFQCRETITSAFLRADHPERLFIAAVDQVSPGDIGCLDIDVPCSQDSTQVICKYRDQISVFKVDAMYSTGPVTARHIGDRMYRGEYFVMQMDAHCDFIQHWDTSIISQWRKTGNEMAVLSTYLSDVQGSLTKDFQSTRRTRPIMCNSAFEGAMPAKYLRHGAQPEEMASIKDMPQLEPYWAAGFSFSRGHFKLRVPYDAYLPMVFQGEEISISVRGFTHGYDFYAAHDSVVFHEYAVKSKRRKKVHMFWENNKHAGMGSKSLRRATSIIGMAPDIDPETWDHREIDRYGLGTVRTTELFYKLFLINPKERQSVQICPFVKSGIMHRAFQPHLRKDGNGIDYTELQNYDSLAAIEEQLVKQQPGIEQQVLNAIKTRDRGQLLRANENAVRVHLDVAKPQVMAQLQAAMENNKKSSKSGKTKR